MRPDRRMDMVIPVYPPPNFVAGGIITPEKVGQSWQKSNLMCNSSYGSLLPSFIQICESIAKKSPEN